MYSLRGFLSIDIDVSGLYINQCDMSNQFYSDSHHNSHFRYSSKFNHNPQLFTHPIISLQSPSPFHVDNEIYAFHDSHKCHRDSMDVSAFNHNLIVTVTGDCFKLYYCFTLFLISITTNDIKLIVHHG